MPLFFCSTGILPVFLEEQARCLCYKLADSNRLRSSMARPFRWRIGSLTRFIALPLSFGLNSFGRHRQELAEVDRPARVPRLKRGLDGLDRAMIPRTDVLTNITRPKSQSPTLACVAASSGSPVLDRQIRNAFASIELKRLGQGIGRGKRRGSGRQLPQWSSIGTSGGNARLVNTSPRNTHDPIRGLIRHVFLPIQPMPARAASSRSMIGAVSDAAARFDAGHRSL